MDTPAMGGRGRGKRRRAAPQMNVTPLVDVVLVLLIIFMVITPLLAKQFWVHMPDQDKDEEVLPMPDNDGPIVVSVAPGGAIRINRQVVPDAEFGDKLRRVLAAKGTRTIFFDSADGAEFA
ncbi:MAG: biopolymer transporter ExbD, partial [Myxococcales bacterium]|nr:biopolymer transporter ExbD [Myxococcales bacterium]